MIARGLILVGLLHFHCGFLSLCQLLIKFIRLLLYLCRADKIVIEQIFKNVECPFRFTWFYIEDLPEC